MWNLFCIIFSLLFKTSYQNIFECWNWNNIKTVFVDVPFAKIPNELTVYCGQTAKLESEISSCPSPNEAYWQKSIDGQDFHIIDIGEPKYEGSSTDPSSPLLLIPKTTLDDQVYYQLLVRNIFGEHTSDKLYLKVIGSK